MSSNWIEANDNNFYKPIIILFVMGLDMTDYLEKLAPVLARTIFPVGQFASSDFSFFDFWQVTDVNNMGDVSVMPVYLNLIRAGSNAPECARNLSWRERYSPKERYKDFLIYSARNPTPRGKKEKIFKPMINLNNNQLDWTNSSERSVLSETPYITLSPLCVKNRTIKIDYFSL